MNIGFYLESLAESDKIHMILKEVINNKKVNDFSIFYNLIAPLDNNLPCSFFHVSDMWSFEGMLIVDKITNVIKANNIVNKFKIVYYFDKRNHDNIIDILSHKDKMDYIIANGEDMEKEYIRLTNTKPNAVIDNYEKITSMSLWITNKKL